MKDSLLIVDDSPNLHKLVRTYLEDEPIAIHSAYNGSDGISSAARLRPGLILLDVDMPDVDGFEVCRRLKANAATKTLPVIFLTADVSPSNQIKGLDLGANDYMTKRLKPEELRARGCAGLRMKPCLDEVAMVDSLTKLWNRNYLDHHLAAQLALASRSYRSLSCVMGDIDRLGSINRKYGEHIGDEVLRCAAHIMSSHGRTEDMVCYLNSGKFGMLLPGTDHAGAAHLADRVRAEVERQLKTLDGIEVNATCSFGLADTRAGNDSSLLDRADAALYCAEARRTQLPLDQPAVRKGR